jgi:pimeloyl-ACP methyl ester carboxylesterase
LRPRGAALRRGARALCVLCACLAGATGCGFWGVKAQQERLLTEPGVSLGRVAALGNVTTLADQRFSWAQAQRGLWRPFDFMTEGSPGLYFLERYESGKIPVVFVHGMGGTPREFASLIGGLDRRRFQPWVYYYPSGIRLEAVSAHLAQTIQALQARHGFPQLVIVAHSMGGLVARRAILRRAEAAGDHGVTLFVSIASPWNGDERADFGVLAPTPVWSWYDLVPGSEFLTRLFYAAAPGVRRRLPPGTAYHLVFTVVPGGSSDGRVSLDSQLRAEAEAEAAQVHGLPHTHAGVLRDPDTARLLSRVLAGTDTLDTALATDDPSSPAVP